MRAWAIGLSLLITTALAKDCYEEHLELKALDDGKLAAAFTFELRSPGWSTQLQQVADNVQLTESHLLPRSIAAIVRAHHVRELHFTLAAGRWQYDRWGYPLLGDGAAYGAETWAWLEPDPHRTPEQAWSELSNSLAGLFCASLNRLQHAHTTSPKHTFTPSTPLNVSHYDFRHGMLPLERPCTENLTPFVALLPCRNRAGLATLLEPHHLFDAHWQRLGVHVHRSESDELILRLEAEMVADPMRIDQKRGGPGRRDWSFSQTLGKKVERRCEPASRSTIDLWRRDSSQDVGPAGFAMHDQIASWNLRQQPMPVDVIQSWPTEERFVYRASSTTMALTPAAHKYDAAPVRVIRHQGGLGDERGSIGVEIINEHDRPVEVIYLEEWPWWLKAYLHTLTIRDDSNNRRDDALLGLSYLPARDRTRPTQLEARLRIPAKDALHIDVDFDKAYMRYHEYPSDANRGFDVPPAVLILLDDAERPRRRVYSTTTLVRLPTPDFSMPYNVRRALRAA